jgi:antitoxin (DNA-binding transcriptional repressor) of toxin-antitoxin stability system
MKKVTIQKANASLAKYATTLQGEPLVVTAGGRPIAALVPVEGVDLESLAVGTNPDFIELIERSRRQFRNRRSTSLSDLRKELSIPMPSADKRQPGTRKSKMSRKPRGATNDSKV